MTPRIPKRALLIISNFIFVYKLCTVGVTLRFVSRRILLFCFKGEDLFFENK